MNKTNSTKETSTSTETVEPVNALGLAVSKNAMSRHTKAIADAIKLVQNDDGKQTKKADYPSESVVDAHPFVVACPTGFNFKQFKPLKRVDFDNDLAFTEYKISKANFDLNRYAEKVEQAKALGGVTSSKAKSAAKRIPRLLDRLTETIDLLIAEGVSHASISDIIGTGLNRARKLQEAVRDADAKAAQSNKK